MNKRSRRTRRNRNKGFSITELMVTTLVASVMVLGMANVFMADEVARNAQESLSEVQNNGRVALNWLKYDLRMAGHTAQTYTRAPIAITTVDDLVPTVTNNCFDSDEQAFDWAMAILPRFTGEPVPMVYGVDNVTTENTIFGGCISGDDLEEGSDIVSVHYAGTDEVADADLVSGNIYLNSGIGGAVVFQCNADGVDCMNNLLDARADASGTRNHLLVSRAYFIRSWAEAEGDGIPTLVRVDMQPDGEVVHEVLIPGVASMQLTYGVDNDNDGASDQYLNASQMPALSSGGGLPLWTKVKSVRLAMLAQSTDPDYSRIEGVVADEEEADGEQQDEDGDGIHAPNVDEGAVTKEYDEEAGIVRYCDEQGQCEEFEYDPENYHPDEYAGGDGEPRESDKKKRYRHPTKEFEVGGAAVQLEETYTGKVYTTTVAVRNPSARMVF